MSTPPANPQSMVYGVVIAGGRASRMGGDKAFIHLTGRPLIEKVVQRLAAQVSAVMINTNDDPGRFEHFAAPVVADRLPGFLGPLAGIHAAMLAAEANGADHILTVAVDTPFFPEDLYSHLEAARRRAGSDLAIAASNGRLHPVFGLFAVTLADDLARFVTTGGRRMHDWLRPYHPAVAEFPPLLEAGRTLDPFFNINTPEDLADAKDWLAG